MKISHPMASCLALAVLVACGDGGDDGSSSTSGATEGDADGSTTATTTSADGSTTATTTSTDASTTATTTVADDATNDATSAGSETSSDGGSQDDTITGGTTDPSTGSDNTSAESTTTGGNVAINGCEGAGAASDMTGMALVPVAWTLPHQQCILVDVGTTVVWSGNFQFHPLTGGETGLEDAASPITIANPANGTLEAVFDEPGAYGYFCEIHLASMQGVIYVE